MFLRFGQVVGQSGVYYALLIVLAAKVITTLTAFSLAATATNTRVKGGGAYYLISRSLGVEFGGAIGLVFFLAQAVSVSMYVIGFGQLILQRNVDAQQVVHGLLELHARQSAAAHAAILRDVREVRRQERLGQAGQERTGLGLARLRLFFPAASPRRAPARRPAARF